MLDEFTVSLLGHDHVGHMARGPRWQVCAPKRGGCGLVWRLTYTDNEPAELRPIGWLHPEGEPF